MNEAESLLLLPLGTTDVSAVAIFEASKAFTKANRIAWMGSDFKRVMLTKVEHRVIAKTLTVHELTRPARDMRIVAELGVDEHGEVALANFFEVLSRQFRGEVGLLRTDGWANVAYIIGTDRDTWTVNACLNGDGWVVNARPLGSRGEWSPARRFISR